MLERRHSTNADPGRAHGDVSLPPTCTDSRKRKGCLRHLTLLTECRQTTGGKQDRQPVCTSPSPPPVVRPYPRRVKGAESVLPEPIRDWGLRSHCPPSRGSSCSFARRFFPPCSGGAGRLRGRQRGQKNRDRAFCQPVSSSSLQGPHCLCALTMLAKRPCTQTTQGHADSPIRTGQGQATNGPFSSQFVRSQGLPVASDDELGR